MKFKKLSTIIFSFFITNLFLFSVEIPSLTGYVNDNAKIITEKDRTEIEKYLKSLENSTGIQMAVLTIDSLEGDSIENFSIKTAEKWKLGSEKDDNGAILVVALDERYVRIEVGDGLESSLTDVKCGLIIRNVIIPEFKNGNYSEGILKGIQNMGGIASNNTEFVSEDVLNEDSPDDNTYFIVFLIIWFAFVIFVFILAIKNKGKTVYVSGVPHTNQNHHTFTNGNSFSGGGFKGGGGHFSGGGASGHW